MKGKSTKILSKMLTILLIIVAVASVASSVMAAKDPGSITITDSNDFDSIGGRIIGMIQSVGSIAAVAVLVVLGIKYMMGSTEEKAEYKKTMLPYVVGAILIFAASNIASMVFDFASDLK